MIEIVKANLQNAQELTNLARKTQLETFEAKNPPGLSLAYINESLTQPIIENELRDQNSAYFLTYKNGKLIGYLKLRMDNHAENKLAGENSMELQRIYLLADETGKGFGRQQLTFAEDFAIKRGYSILWLGVWEHNQSAFEFYKHCGYSQFGIHEFMYAGEIQFDWMMRKTL
jgi:diamine N-acetyltransferase